MEQVKIKKNLSIFCLSIFPSLISLNFIDNNAYAADMVVSGGGFDNATYSETKSSFIFQVDWDGDLDGIPPVGLFINNTSIDSNEGSVPTNFESCPEKNEPNFCWDFSLSITDAQTGDFPLGISGQHKIEADEGDDPEGIEFSEGFVRNFNFNNPVDEVLPETDLDELLFQKSEPHFHTPLPNHTDLYQLFYRTNEDGSIKFTFIGTHIPANIVVPEPSSTLSLLALGTLSAASTLKRKLKPSQSVRPELDD